MKCHSALSVPGRVLVAIGLLLCSCRASVNAEANAKAGLGASEDEVQDFDKPLEASQDPSPAEGPDTSANFALLGARHDLSYAGTPTATCKCIAAGIGGPESAQFSWEALAPNINRNTEIVVAISSNAIPCPEAKAETLGASYQGYIVEGPSVIVLVEEAQAGRPITAGGIIPRPQAGGALYLQPADASTPYGAALDGSQRCKLSASASAAGGSSQAAAIFKRPKAQKTLKADSEEDPTP